MEPGAKIRYSWLARPLGTPSVTALVLRLAAASGTGRASKPMKKAGRPWRNTRKSALVGAWAAAAASHAAVASRNPPGTGCLHSQPRRRFQSPQAAHGLVFYIVHESDIPGVSSREFSGCEVALPSFIVFLCLTGAMMGLVSRSFSPAPSLRSQCFSASRLCTPWKRTDREMMVGRRRK